MTRAAHAAMFAVVAVVAFTVGARNGAIGAVKLLELRARQLTDARTKAALDLYDEGE